MRECVELSDMAFLKLYLRSMGYPDGVVLVEKYGGFDERIGWNTHLVTIDGNAIGFTDEKP